MNTLRFYFLMFALLLMSAAVHAQSSSKKASYLLKGQLVDADSAVAVTFAHVSNPYKGTITVSNQLGAFTLPVEGGDTLMISRIGYVTLKYVAPTSDPAAVHEIKLQPKTEEMKEVVITKFPTETRFRQQLLSLQLPEDKKPDLKVPHPSTVVIPDANGDITLLKAGGLISGFANRFNDKERGRQFKANMAVKDQQDAYIATRFNANVVQRITGLEDEQKLNEFMKFCVLSDDFLLKASDYEIHEAVLGCFKDFIASN